jgi:spore germination protein GerM
MMTRRHAAIAVLVIFALAAAWILFIGLPHWYAARRPQATTTAAPVSSQPGTTAERRISATLFYVGPDGTSLLQTPREVAYGATTAEQARAIVAAQIASAPPLLSAVPPDTRLRDVFVTAKGDAFVDLSGEVRTKHTGGSLDEILTVYTIVNALTVNLPAITRVQILIDGKEVDTLAGHVDLRHPLAKSLEWVAHDTH